MGKKSGNQSLKSAGVLIAECDRSSNGSETPSKLYLLRATNEFMKFDPCKGETLVVILPSKLT